MRLYERFLKKAPKQSRSRSLVESVLSATNELLGRHDDEAEVTIQAVAERAGVGVGSLYDYFVNRGSVFSGLTAKLTEDNLRRFEAELETCRGSSLEATVRRIVDLLWEMYLGDPRIPRILLRVAHRAGLMPLLAKNHELFGRSLAKFFRERGDVNPPDVDIAAYVLTNMALGVVHTLVWAEERPFADDALKEEIVRVSLAHLTRTA